MKLNFTLLLIISLFFCKASFTQVNVQDSLALVDLYDSAKGSIEWTLTMPVSKWKGVTVANNRVTQLVLNYITGAMFRLPKSIGNLTELINLDINYSFLTGQIPESIGNLRKLKTLALAWDRLTDTIPGSIGNLLNLELLNLNNDPVLGKYYGHYLSGNIPSSLGNLTKLRQLALSDNNLSGAIPSSFGNLTNLESLLLSSNQLADSIPSSLGNLPKLQDLGLYSNNLSGPIPFSIGNLKKLSFLDLSMNQLTDTIPSSIGNLDSLTTLRLSSNKLTGSIPISLGNLHELQYLELDTNLLSGIIPPSLSRLSKLTTLYLNNNQLTGSIPASFGDFDSLEILYLSSNKLTGKIPFEFGNLSHLYSLRLDSNMLSGAIPSSLLKLTSNWGFHDLLLNSNRFTFNGIEPIVQAFQKYPLYLRYDEQAVIPVYNKNGTLQVSVGGTPSNNTYRWYKADSTVEDGYSVVSTKIGDSVFIPTEPGMYAVEVQNSIARDLILSSTIIPVGGDSLILPAKPSTILANREYTNSDGWTDYYYDNNTPYDISDDTLLLSLKKNGQNIGSIGDGTFAVKVVATKDAGTNKGIFLSNPLITNSSGYWVMNRYWQVTPSSEPIKSVGVKFYYNKQDVKDVNGSYPTHNLTNQELIMYKAIDGNPDPTTNLSGATRIISIMPGNAASDTTWTYHQLSDTTQYAEYSVSSFSGGGGGGTGNNKSLPITLVNFTANLNNSNAVLNWQTVTEINSSYFNIQRSLDGRNFTTITKINAAGNSSLKLNYEYTDPSIVKIFSGRIYYRLIEVDKNGISNFSKTISLDLPFADKHITILPNPVHDILQVQLTKFEGKAVISIYDIKGRKLQSKHVTLTGNQDMSFNVASLPGGVYIIKVENAAKEETLQFVKQ